MNRYILKNQAEIIRQEMVKRRIAFNHTRKEVSEMSGIAYGTLMRFEQQGEISLKNLLKLIYAYKMEKKFINAFLDKGDLTIEEIKNLENKKRVRNA